MKPSTSLVLLACALLVAQITCQTAVLVGGGLADNNTEIWNTFLSLGTINGVLNVGIVTAASDDSADSISYYEALLPISYGVQNVSWIPIDTNNTNNAFNQTVVNQISQYTAIWFAGGDQDRVAACFFYKNGSNPKAPTPVFAAIQARYNAGQLIVGGSSAGTDIQQGTPMVDGGLSWDALVYGSFPNISNKYPDDLTYYSSGGFGFFGYGYLDTHVGTRGRQGRMLRLVWDLRANSSYLYGIDENTALVLQNGVGYVIGESGMYVVDVTQAATLQTENGGFAIDNVLFSYLTEGDYYYFNNRTIQFAPWKINLAGRQTFKTPYKPSQDIFDYGSNAPGETWTNITQDLFNVYGTNTTYAYSYEDDPTYVIDFDKTNAVGVYGQLAGVTFISYQNLRVKASQLSSRVSEEESETGMSDLFLGLDE